MQTTSAPMAWLFLPENEQVQYLQKIALRAENPSEPRYVVIWSRRIFCVSNFLLPLRQHIFRQQRQGIEPAVSCHFHLIIKKLKKTSKTKKV